MPQTGMTNALIMVNFFQGVTMSKEKIGNICDKGDGMGFVVDQGGESD